MHVSHLTFAAGPAGLEAEAERLGELLGEKFKDGGFHPRFGTRNKILPLKDGRYLEIVEVLDHPAADKAPFGQFVRARSAMGGGWLAWVVAVDDLGFYETKLGRRGVDGTRRFPDGRVLQWRQIGVKGVQADPQLPYFIEWKSPADVLPSALSGSIELLEIEIAGSRPRVEDWLGAPIGEMFDGVHINFVAPNGQPGLDAITLRKADGAIVRI